MAKFLSIPMILSGILVITPIGVTSLDSILYLFFVLFYLFFNNFKLPKKELIIFISIISIFFVILSAQILLINIVSIQNYLINAIRFLYILLAAFFVARILNINLKNSINALNASLIISAFFLIYDYFLPMFIEYSEYTYLGISNFPRPRGLHAEPSFYVIFCACILIIREILFVNYQNIFSKTFTKSSFLKTDIVLLISFFLSLSISGIIVSLYIISRHLEFNILNKRNLSILLIFALLLTTLLASNSSYFISRFVDFGTDNSFFLRLIGGVSLGYFTIINEPLLGFGFGHMQLGIIMEQISNLNEFLPSAYDGCIANATCSPNTQVSPSMFISYFYFVFGLPGVLFLMYILKLTYHIYGISVLLLLFFTLVSKGDIYYIYFYVTFFLLLNRNAYK